VSLRSAFEFAAISICQRAQNLARLFITNVGIQGYLMDNICKIKSKNRPRNNVAGKG
jgi:hypothetical protein